MLLFSITHTRKESRAKSNDFGKKSWFSLSFPDSEESFRKEPFAPRQTSLPPRKISPTAGFYLQTLFSRKKLLAVENLALYSN